MHSTLQKSQSTAWVALGILVGRLVLRGQHTIEQGCTSESSGSFLNVQLPECHPQRFRSRCTRVELQHQHFRSPPEDSNAYPGHRTTAVEGKVLDVESRNRVCPYSFYSLLDFFEEINFISLKRRSLSAKQGK